MPNKFELQQLLVEHMKISTADFLELLYNTAFQKGVERGKFDLRMELNKEKDAASA